MSSSQVKWTPEARALVAPSKLHDVVKAELPPAAVAWTQLRTWIASQKSHVVGAELTDWLGEAPPSSPTVEAAATAWRLLGQGFDASSGEREFACFFARSFGLPFTLDAFIKGPPVRITFRERRLGVPGTARTADAWRALRLVWLAATEAERQAALPLVRAAPADESLAMMLEESAVSPLTASSVAGARARLGELTWAAVQAVHGLRFDLLARFGADAAPLLIEALGVAREHAAGVEFQRDFVSALTLVESALVAEHLKAEQQLPGTKDLAEAYFAPAADDGATSNEVVDEAAMESQKRWSLDAFKRGVLHQPISRLLVWAAYDDGNFILDTFRVAADGALKTGSDDDYELPEDGATVGIVRAEELDKVTLAQWSKVFADQLLEQPFPQL